MGKNKAWVAIAALLLMMGAPIQFVNGDPEIILSADYPAIVSPSSTFTMNVTILNGPTDNDPIANPRTTVSTFHPEYFTFESTNRVELSGRVIQSDGKKYGVGLFTIRVAPNAPQGNYNINVELRYSWNLRGGIVWSSSGQWIKSFPIVVGSGGQPQTLPKVDKLPTWSSPPLGVNEREDYESWRRQIMSFYLSHSLTAEQKQEIESLLIEASRDRYDVDNKFVGPLGPSSISYVDPKEAYEYGFWTEVENQGGVYVLWPLGGVENPFLFNANKVSGTNMR